MAGRISLKDPNMPASFVPETEMMTMYPGLSIREMVMLSMVPLAQAWCSHEDTSTAALAEMIGDAPSDPWSVAKYDKAVMMRASQITDAFLTQAGYEV